MGTNGSFFQNGLPISTAETGIGNVSPGTIVPNNANSSFYLNGTIYETLENQDQLLALLLADTSLVAADLVAANVAATNSANSATAAAASLATLNSTALLKANNLSDLGNLTTALTNIGLQNVNNTSDANKPLSNADIAALALKAPLASPVLTGTPTAPTAAALDNSFKLATTAYADGAVSVLSSSVTASLALKAPLASPALTGVPTAPTPAANNNSTQLATTAYVDAGDAVRDAAIALKAPLASPTLTGTPAAPTAAVNTNTTQLATTAFVLGQASGATPQMDGAATSGVNAKYARDDHVHPTDSTRAPLASPALTGVPTAPTATVGTNTTQLATTAFVIANAASAGVASLGAQTGVLTVPGGSFGSTALSLLRYDAAQTLTATQKAQARANIDALKKNYIMNGAMMVSQENGTTAGTTSGYFAVDQFKQLFSNTSVPSFAQVVSRTPGGSPNRIRLTVSTADNSVTAGKYHVINQPFEGLRVADLAWGTASAKSVTIQFGVKSNIAMTGCVTVANALTNRSYVSEYTIAAGEVNTDLVRSVTIPGDTTGTWATDNTGGIYVYFGLMCGSTFQQAAGSWGSANALGSANQTNFMATNGNVFELFDVGMYEGAAPSFQVPDYSATLLECKRHYQNIGLIYVEFGASAGTVLGGTQITFPVETRVTPTITLGASPTTINSTTVLTSGGTNTLGFGLQTTATAAGRTTYFNLGPNKINARL